MRLSDEFIAKIDSWAEKQDDRPGRTEAIRRLVEIGLAAGEAKMLKLDQRTVQKASSAIDNMASDIKRAHGKLGPRAKK